MPPEDNAESTLIWYNSLDEKNYEHWVNELDTFLESKYNFFFTFLEFKSDTR
jgi:hypothetical protein